MNAKYTHTNLIACDWRALAKFYEDVFGCKPCPPERYYDGPELEAGTGIARAIIQGVHLRLPGHGDNGPTLEIFNYNTLEERPKTAVNRPGFSHLAFEVDNMESARNEVLSAGGKILAEMVTLETPTGARVTWQYLTDPEGNIVELQMWER